MLPCSNQIARSQKLDITSRLCETTTIVVPRCWNFVHPLDAFLFEEGIADRHLVYQPDLGIAVNSNGKFLRAPVTDGLSTDLRTRI